MVSLDWSQCSAVESIPDKVTGAWVFKGTHQGTGEGGAAVRRSQPRRTSPGRDNGE